jgi:hypothetical protein
MVSRGRTTKKITVTLPIEDAEAMERLAESGQVESVSRYVTEAVAFRRVSEAFGGWVLDHHALAAWARVEPYAQSLV